MFNIFKDYPTSKENTVWKSSTTNKYDKKENYVTVERNVLPKTECNIPMPEVKAPRIEDLELEFIMRFYHLLYKRGTKVYTLKEIKDIILQTWPGGYYAYEKVNKLIDTLIDSGVLETCFKFNTDPSSPKK